MAFDTRLNTEKQNGHGYASNGYIYTSQNTHHVLHMHYLYGKYLEATNEHTQM